MSRERRPQARTIEAVERALAAIDSLEEAGELGTNELARRIGAHPSSVSRLLATLERRGFVTHTPQTGRYRLGLRLVELGSAALASLDLRELARPHLRALVQETGETATLSVPGDRDSAITIDFAQSPRSVVSIARLGRPSVGHATATGKVMLAFGASVPSAPLERFTERTITERPTLERELARVRSQGWAEAREEREEGLAAVAAPVFGRAGELQAILGLQGPAERLRGGAKLDAVGRVRERAAILSTSLGHLPVGRPAST
jgi:IclR family acetate operon transcriptional repressor